MLLSAAETDASMYDELSSSFALSFPSRVSWHCDHSFLAAWELVLVDSQESALLLRILERVTSLSVILEFGGVSVRNYRKTMINLTS